MCLFPEWSFEVQEAGRKLHTKTNKKSPERKSHSTNVHVGRSGSGRRGLLQGLSQKEANAFRSGPGVPHLASVARTSPPGPWPKEAKRQTTSHSYSFFQASNSGGMPRGLSRTRASGAAEVCSLPTGWLCGQSFGTVHPETGGAGHHRTSRRRAQAGGQSRDLAGKQARWLAIRLPGCPVDWLWLPDCLSG